MTLRRKCNYVAAASQRQSNTLKAGLYKQLRSVNCVVNVFEQVKHARKLIILTNYKCQIQSSDV